MNHYTITITGQQFRDKYDLEPSMQYRPQFNAAPTHQLPILTNKNPTHFSFFRWGNTPEWANKRPLGEKQIEIDFEQQQEKRLFQSQLSTNRCLIPADGIYLWKEIGKRKLVPYRGIIAEMALFFLLGIWEEYEDEHGNITDTFRVIVLENKAQENTVPLIVPLEEMNNIRDTKKWHNSLNRCLAIQNDLGWNFYPVSPKIKDTANNDPELINEVPPSDQFGNYQLFS
jgi:putative SOS response-associated peptidase YedK